MRHAIDKLTDDQVVALSDYINTVGRYWRKRFAEDDELGGNSCLSQLRNKYGAIIAHSLDTNAVHADAEAVRKARNG